MSSNGNFGAGLLNLAGVGIKWWFIFQIAGLFVVLAVVVLMLVMAARAPVRPPPVPILPNPPIPLRPVNPTMMM